MPRKNQPEPTEPVFDRSIYDVTVDKALIDYVATKQNIVIDDQFYTTAKAHAVSLRADGWTDKEVCKGLGIGRSQLAIWQESDDLYRACIDFVKDIETADAEQVTWRNAIENPNANIERMFALKARKPEYRDNSQLPTSNEVNLYIGIDGANVIEKFRMLNAVNDSEKEDDLD